MYPASNVFLLAGGGKQGEAGSTEMFVTDGASELLSSKCCFFLRNAKEGASLDTAR